MEFSLFVVKSENFLFISKKVCEKFVWLKK